MVETTTLDNKELETAIDAVIHSLCSEADKPQLVNDVAVVVKAIILDLRRIANAVDRSSRVRQNEYERKHL